MTKGRGTGRAGSGVPAARKEVDLLGQVSVFRKRFGGSHFGLLLHAAVPLRLSPELLSLIRTNFVPEVPTVAESDILLAPFCRHHGGPLFSIPEEIREYLLLTLETHPRWGRERLLDLSRFLLFFSHDFEPGADDVLKRHFRELQRWTSWAHLDPEQAAEGLANRMSSALAQGDRSDLLRTARIASTLSAPFWNQDGLLLYSTAVETLATGGVLETGTVQDMGGYSQPIQIGSIQLPSPAALTGALRSDLDLSPDLAQEAARQDGFELRYRLEGHRADISDLAFSSDGRLLASVSMNGEIKVWDPATGSLEFETRFKGPAFCAGFLPHQNRLLVGLAQGGIRRIDLDSEVPGRATAELATEAPSIVELSVSPDGQVLAAGTMNGQLLLMSPRDGTDFQEFQLARGPLNGIAWAPDGKSLVVAADTGALFRWEADSTEDPVELRRGESAAGGVVRTGAGRTLAIAYDSGLVEILEASSLELRRELKVAEREIICLDFSGDDQLLAVKSFDGRVSLWRAETGEMLGSLAEKMKSTKRGGLAFSPSESLLATTDDEETTVRLWRLRYNDFLKISKYRYGKIVLLGHAQEKPGQIVELLHSLSRARSTGPRGQHLRTLSYRIRGEEEKQEILLWDLISHQQYPIFPQLHLAGSDAVLFLADPQKGREESLSEQIHWVNQAAQGSNRAISGPPTEEIPSFERETDLQVIKLLLVPGLDEHEDRSSRLSEFAASQGLEGPVPIQNREDLGHLLSRLNQEIVAPPAESAAVKEMAQSAAPTEDPGLGTLSPNQILSAMKESLDEMTPERSLVTVRELFDRVVSRMSQLTDDGFRDEEARTRLMSEQMQALQALEKTGAIHLLQHPSRAGLDLESVSSERSREPLVLLEPNIRDYYLETIRLKLAGAPEPALPLEEVLNWRLGSNAEGRHIRPPRDEPRFLRAFVDELLELEIALLQEETPMSYLYFPNLARPEPVPEFDGVALLLVPEEIESVDLEQVSQIFQSVSTDSGFQPLVRFGSEAVELPENVRLVLALIDEETVRGLNWDHIASVADRGTPTALLYEEKMEFLPELPFEPRQTFSYPKGGDLEGVFTAALMVARQDANAGDPNSSGE